MIYDKIKIYVPKRIVEILDKDAEGFEFFKGDGIQINRNAFLSALIINYFDKFRSSQEELLSSIKLSLLSCKNLTDIQVSELSSTIVNSINQSQTKENNDAFDSLVSLKPTKETQPIIDYIDEYLLNNRSLSEYFRTMFTNYCRYSQDRREEIIFRKNYETISNAISSKKNIFITTKYSKSKRIQELSPFSFARSKEELHIYLLASYNKLPKTIRLSRIVSVKELQRTSSFSDNEISIYEKMKEFGPQFFYGKNDREIAVELTSFGKDLYKRIYLHRPSPVEIKDNIYIFRCSHQQVTQYFKRFGKDAIIISPLDATKEVYIFYSQGKRAYKNKFPEL